jgi:hypothetical protein
MKYSPHLFRDEHEKMQRSIGHLPESFLRACHAVLWRVRASFPLAVAEALILEHEFQAGLILNTFLIDPPQVFVFENGRVS